ncbi:unnamed protein product [Paramecium sonneborni]|uniref:Uncharacterized protein n=1 Tax=Paramecium sonneborni TaxID=65129 RepID=A0A8S1RI07_9CILI|nr:unnamed protein product [Paramecium sonneborni]
MQQLQSKMNEIFEFTISLPKEVQSKGWLSKQSIIKINDQYKEFSYLLMKKQPNPQLKQDNNSILQKMYFQMTEYLTTQFIQQLNLQQQNESVYLNAIFAPIIIAIAIVDNDFPRCNSKIPLINLKLISKIFQNASQTVQTIKQFPKLLLQRQIQEKDLCLFQESLEILQSLMSQQEAVTIIQNQELYLIIRQCYVMQQCFEFMENLRIENNHILQLNDNKKYEDQWKQIGTRYASKKNKEDIIQIQNQEMLDKFGIDFNAWQLNLQIQENEIKKIKRLENEQLWKDKRNEKQLQKQVIQKENQEILRENEEQYKQNQAIKEHEKQKKAQEFRERQQQKAFSFVMMKQQQKCEQQDMRKNQSQIIKQRSEILSIQKLDLKMKKIMLKNIDKIEQIVQEDMKKRNKVIDKKKKKRKEFGKRHKIYQQNKVKCYIRKNQFFNNQKIIKDQKKIHIIRKYWSRRINQTYIYKLVIYLIQNFDQLLFKISCITTIKLYLYFCVIIINNFILIFKMETLNNRKTQSIEQEAIHYPLDSQKSEETCQRNLKEVAMPKISAILIENNDLPHEIPTGQPIYVCTKCKKELRSLKILYSFASMLLLGFILGRIIPQFIYDGCFISAILWACSSAFYILNLILYCLCITKRPIFNLTIWIFGNCLIFLLDLVATIIALGTPMYSKICEKSQWKNEQDDCQIKKQIKDTFSIIYITFLLAIGIIHGCLCYKGYQIRKLYKFQQKLSNSVPSSTQIQF